MWPKFLSSRRNRFILAGVTLLALAVSIYFWQQQATLDRAAQAAIRSEPVVRGTIVATVSATGTLSPHSQVNLFFSAPSNQPVAAVEVVVGRQVHRGDVLAHLDDRDLALAVTQAEQNLQAAQLKLALLTAPARPEDLAVAEANLRLANAQLVAAQQSQSPEAVQSAWLNLLLARNMLDQTYATMKQLEDSGHFADKLALQPQADQQVQAAKIAELQYLDAQNPPADGPIASARAAVAQAQATRAKLKDGPTEEDRQIAKLQVDQAQAALDLARHNLAGAALVAPFDGVVAAVNLHVGEPASGALPAMTLADTNHFYLDVSVDEVDVARVAPGQRVTITLDALPNALLTGRVERIAPAASNNAGVVNYSVRLALEAADQPLRGGMTATAEIVVAEANDVLVVPNWAIRRDRQTGQTFAGVLRQGQVVDVPIEIGLRNETASEVTSGLNEGEVVAVDTRREQLRLIGGNGQ